MIDTRTNIRPVILAGGLGTRLRPRTNVIPKPLLPVAGRPLLWYALNALQGNDLLRPIVTLDYKADLIEAFFDGWDASFRVLSGLSMAETILRISEEEVLAEAFLGMSSDVLVPKSAVEKLIHEYSASREDTALFVRLPEPGHKRWEFVVSEDRLVDIRVRDVETNFERLLLLLRVDSLRTLARCLPRPISEDNAPPLLNGFQSGWILLLKALAAQGNPIRARFTPLSVCNVNVPADFARAERFVAEHLQ